MYVFIVNPEAGNGRGRRVFAKIKKSDVYKQLERTYFYTRYEGHAKKLAKRYRRDSAGKTIIVIGGDGTIHEVIHGLREAGIPVGFIPGGSGNDFARGCGIEGEPEEILRGIVFGNKVLPYWTGTYQKREAETRLFINSIGLGFDARIAKKVNNAKYKHFFNLLGMGRISYVIALIQILIHFKPMELELETDQGKRTLKNCWMAAVGNHPYYGGGMKIIPGAVNQPEILTLLIIHSVARWKVLALFSTVFFRKHTLFKEVERLHTSFLNISATQEFTFQADGQTDTATSLFVTKRNEPMSIIGIK